jgi:hypothetical protein
MLALAGSFCGGAAVALESQSTGQGASAGHPSRTCPPHRGSNIPRPQGRDATPAEKAAFIERFNRSPTGTTIVSRFSVSMAQAAAKRRNMTLHTHDSSHGNQVEFFTSDGHTYLWYPGNAVVLKGEWRACEDRFSVTVKGADTVMIPFGKMCFKYGTNTYNPATGAKGGEWECAPASRVDARLVEQRPGDVFGLAKRVNVPFVLPREKTTMNELLARIPKDQPR